MNVEDTVRRLLMDWPSLYKSRSDVMENLFCCYGTGYDWIDGEIAFEYGEDAYQEMHARARERRPVTDDPQVILAARRAGMSEQERQREDERAAEMTALLAKYPGEEPYVPVEVEVARLEADEARYVWENIDALCQRRMPRPQIYPMSEYSPLARIPDDVKDDWLDAAQEAVWMVLASVTTSDASIGYSVEQQERAVFRQHEYARDAQARINQIRKARQHRTQSAGMGDTFDRATDRHELLAQSRLMTRLRPAPAFWKSVCGCGTVVRDSSTYGKTCPACKQRIGQAPQS